MRVGHPAFLTVAVRQPLAERHNAVCDPRQAVLHERIVTRNNQFRLLGQFADALKPVVHTGNIVQRLKRNWV